MFQINKIKELFYKIKLKKKIFKLLKIYLQK
jgi:hypothetical protein